MARRDRGVRFFAWYRMVPLALVLLLGAVSYLYSYAPSALLSYLYPLRYEEEIAALKGHAGKHFRGISYNAGMTDLIDMMNVGSVSVNFLF